MCLKVVRPGSRHHGYMSRCSPCAWFWKARGCNSSFDCTYCHLCPEGTRLGCDFRASCACELAKVVNYIHTYIHYITLHYITLHYITLHYITLHYITLHYITLHTYLHTCMHACNIHILYILPMYIYTNTYKYIHICRMHVRTYAILYM